jgi:protease-4
MLLGMRRPGEGPEEPAAPAVALIYAVGPIINEEPDDLMFGEPVVSAPMLIKIIRKAAEQKKVRAIVLRVDSPGGSAEASDLIWHELRRADEVKPVVVSLSDVAGSGGYYIATGGRLIYADAGTITGSIGVMGGKFVLGGLFEKLGLSVDVFERGANAGIFSSVEEFSESQRRRLRELLAETYRLFLERIAASRRQSVEELREVAQGQVWSGWQARRGRLVDGIGGLKDVIQVARKEAGIPPGTEVEILRLPRSRSVLELLMQGESAGAPMRGALPVEALSRELGALRGYLLSLRCMSGGRAAALMPGLVTVR